MLNKETRQPCRGFPVWDKKIGISIYVQANIFNICPQVHGSIQKYGKLMEMSQNNFKLPTWR
jgi:hypothetical protein